MRLVAWRSFNRFSWSAAGGGRITRTHRPELRACKSHERVTVMSAAQEDGSVEAGPTPAQDLYREKPVSTVVRVFTVLAYLLSVSLAAILLSVYYICVWKSPDLPMSAHEMLNARRGDPNDYTFAYDASYNSTGKV